MVLLASENANLESYKNLKALTSAIHKCKTPYQNFLRDPTTEMTPTSAPTHTLFLNLEYYCIST